MRSEPDLYARVTAGYAALLLTVYLFCFGPRGYLNISEIKHGVFYALCGGYCAVISGLLLVRRDVPLRRADVRPAQICAALYLLLTLAATLVSPYRSQAWLGASRGEGFCAIALYVLPFLCVSRFARPRAWMVHLLGGACTAFAVVCVLQLQSVNVFGLFPDGLTFWDGNVLYRGQYIGTIGNVDHVAAFLSLAIPMLWCAVLRLRGRWRFWLLVPLALLGYVLVRIDVAAGLVGVFAGSLLCLPVVLPGSNRRRLARFALLAALVAAGLVCLRLRDFGSQTLHEAHELLNGRWSPRFGSGRLYIWQETLTRAARRPAFGYGPDTMILTGIEPFRRYDERLGTTVVSMIDAAHNEYLNILFHQGVFALLAYLGAIGAALVGWLRRARESAAAAICGCGVLCCGVQAFFGISQVITTPYFWLALALLVRSGRAADETE